MSLHTRLQEILDQGGELFESVQIRLTQAELADAINAFARCDALDCLNKSTVTAAQVALKERDDARRERDEARAEVEELRRGFAHKDALAASWREKCLKEREEFTAAKESTNEPYRELLRSSGATCERLEAENAAMKAEVAAYKVLAGTTEVDNTDLRAKLERAEAVCEAGAALEKHSPTPTRYVGGQSSQQMTRHTLAVKLRDTLAKWREGRP